MLAHLRGTGKVFSCAGHRLLLPSKVIIYINILYLYNYVDLMFLRCILGYKSYVLTRVCMIESITCRSLEKLNSLLHSRNKHSCYLPPSGHLPHQIVDPRIAYARHQLSLRQTTMVAQSSFFAIFLPPQFLLYEFPYLISLMIAKDSYEI